MPRRRVVSTITLVVILCASCARSAAWLRTIANSSRAAWPTGSVHEDTFFSSALGVRKHVVIYLPPSYAADTTRRYPVAYYLHGLSGTETDWVSKGSIDAAADSLFAFGTPEMILVMPDGDDGWYTTWVNQVAYRTCADTLHSEAPDRYCVEHERYGDYIAHDVVQHVDQHYRTLADRAHRGIGGLSMGGYGALIITLHNPEVFGSAASHSGALSPMYTGTRPFSEPARYASTVDEIRPMAGPYWNRYLNYWGTNLDRWREADPARAAELLVRRNLQRPGIFIDCGIDDGFVDQNRALHAELTRLRIEHAYAEWPGAHTWRYWSTHVAQSLGWMGRRIGR
jgi:S-formylglutathione hydrolase FrmB